MCKYDYALYCRGFVFSDEEVTPPKSDWKKIEISPSEGSKYYVWTDKKNGVAYCKRQDKWCFMIGMAMDTVDWHMELDLICKKCAEFLCNGENSFYEYIDTLNGRFALFFGDGEHVSVLNDATATRSVYYHEKKCLIASHYRIIAELENEKEHPYMQKYDAITKFKPWTLPGDMTPFENVRILIANHELDLKKLTIRRFYPRGNHKIYSFREIMNILPTHLKNQVNTLAKYETPLISVTGGNDSRVTMSASRDVRHKAVYFTFANQNTDTKNLDQLHRFQDCEYARYICDLYDLNFKKLVLKPPLRSDMEEVVKKNHYHMHIPSAIPEYIDKLPRGIHIQSNLIEIVRDLTYVYPKPPKNNTKQEIMAGWMMYWNQRFEIKEYIDSFWERNQWDDIYDYERVRLFYWEHRMSTWNSAATLLENDWAFNTYLLFNCRKLLEMGFCLPKYARDKNMVTRNIVKELWPELLFRIANSEDTLYDYYDVDGCGKIEIKNNCKLVTNVPGRVILLDRVYSAMLSFDKPRIYKEEFCELTLPEGELKKKAYQIRLSVPTNSLLEEGYLSFYVRANSNEVYSGDVATLTKSALTVNVNCEEGLSELAIGIRCEKGLNCEEYGKYAVLNIDSIVSTEKEFLDEVKINI